MDAWQKNNSIYYIDETSGLVLCYNLNNTIDYYDNVDLKENTTVRRIIEYNSQYYLVTNTGIVRYDFNKKDQGKYIYDISEFKNGIKEAVLWDGIIISITGNLKNELICYNIEKDEGYLCNDIIITLNSFKLINKFMIATIKLIDDSLFFTLIDDNKLYSYNLIKKLIHIECEFDDTISGFDYYNNTFWIRYTDGFQIAEWNKENGVIQKYSLRELKEEERTEKHAKVIVANNRVILLPTMSNTFAYVDFDNDCITRIESKTELKRSLNRQKNTFTIGNLIVGNQIVCLPWASDSAVIINTDTMGMEIYQPKMHQNVYLNDMKLRKKHNKIIYETSEECFELFIKNII